MNHYRPTRVLVDVDAIGRNVRAVLKAFPGYEHYMAVIKADCYGLGLPVVQTLLDSGCDYLAVSLAEEALAVRAVHADIPILVFVPAPDDALPALRDNNVAVTVATPDQAGAATKVAGLKVFIRVNGGHDLFGGPTTKAGFDALYRLIVQSGAALEGLYLHNYHPEDRPATDAEYAMFEELTDGIDLGHVPVVSTSNSLTLPRYPRRPYSNTCRIGNIMYGIENDSMGLESCFQLVSEVTQVLDARRGQSIGYAGAYVAQAERELVAVVPIGYGDGLAKINCGRDVYIHDKRFPIVAVTMDVTLVRVDESVHEGDPVVLIRDARHLEEIAAHTHGVAEEPICLLNARVPRLIVQTR